MENEKEEKAYKVGEMNKRRIKMEEGGRYLIFYSFGPVEKTPIEPAEKDKKDV